MPFSRMEKVVLITSSIIFSLFFVYLFYRVSERDSDELLETVWVWC